MDIVAATDAMSIDFISAHTQKLNIETLPEWQRAKKKVSIYFIDLFVVIFSSSPLFFPYFFFFCSFFSFSHRTNPNRRIVSYLIGMKYQTV